MNCERCKREVYKYNVCNYCDRKVCFDCLKSQKKISGAERAYICKDCWSNLKKRSKYKSYMILKVATSPYPERSQR